MKTSAGKTAIRSRPVDRSKFHFVAKDLAEGGGEEVFRPCTQEVACTGFLRTRSNFNACEKVCLFALEKIAPVEAGVSRYIKCDFAW